MSAQAEQKGIQDFTNNWCISRLKAQKHTENIPAGNTIFFLNRENRNSVGPD
jgi:hypothetical protein